MNALALHPTGLFVAIGFSDQLHLMEILLSTLKTVKSFAFPKCNEIVFSHQGHLLACASGSMITILSVFGFNVLGSLKVINTVLNFGAWSNYVHNIIAGSQWTSAEHGLVNR